MIQTFLDAVALEPWVISNGGPDAMVVPNHLLAQGFYLLRARTQLREIDNILLPSPSVALGQFALHQPLCLSWPALPDATSPHSCSCPPRRGAPWRFPPVLAPAASPPFPLPT